MILPIVTFMAFLIEKQRVILEVLKKELLQVNLHSLNHVKTQGGVRGSLHMRTYWQNE